MLDICFGDSECGTIKMALGKKDVLFAFNDLGYGKIADKDFAVARMQWLKDYFRECSESVVEAYWNKRKEAFANIISAAKSGEDLRIWYDSTPCTKTGFYHLIYNLKDYNCRVFVIELLLNTQDEREFAWGEMDAEEIADSVKLQRELTKEEITHICSIWEKLVKENADLRLNINGQLCSVPTDYLDEDFLSYMPRGKCKLSNYVGIIMLKCTHYIQPTFVTERIEHLISEGRILVIKRADETNGEYYGSQTILKRT